MTGHAFDPDPAPVRLYNASGDRETETCAAARSRTRLVAAIEPLEHMRYVVFRDPFTGVLRCVKRAVIILAPTEALRTGWNITNM